MARIIDGDSHFNEPMELFEKYIDPKYRERTLRIVQDPATGRGELVVDGQRLKSFGGGEELLAVVTGFGQKEEGRRLGTFDEQLPGSSEWQDMDKRVSFLDGEGIAAQVIHPTAGILWEEAVTDPKLAEALCQAYNTWAFELCASHQDRLYPSAHISLHDPQLAVREMGRVAKLGCRVIFVGAAPLYGKSFGHSDFDPVWAAAQDLNLAIALHPTTSPNPANLHQYYPDHDPGFLYYTTFIQEEPRLVLGTMMYDGVFERFARLRVGVLEARSGWIGEWLERFDYKYSYAGHTSPMKRRPSEYFAQNVWINADPYEKTLPLMVQFLGDEKFFIGSDYPHAEGFAHPVQRTREVLSGLPEASVERILGTNASKFFGL